MAQAPFQVMEIFDDVDDAQCYFDTLHKQILDQHAPIKSIVIRPNQPPFMNCSLMKVAHRKAQLQNRVRRFPNRKNFENFRVIRNKTTSIR